MTESQQVFPGHGVIKPKHAKIERLKKKAAKLLQERVAFVIDYSI